MASAFGFAPVRVGFRCGESESMHSIYSKQHMVREDSPLTDYDVTGSLTSLGGNLVRLIELRISMVGSMGLRSILHSYFGGSLVSSLMEKAPFPLLFSIGILFHLFYIGNGFSESLHLPK